MSSLSGRATLLVTMLVAASACGGNTAVPSQVSNLDARRAAPADTTSILKKLTKNIEIGSTVDPANGDTGPCGLSMVTFGYGRLKKGDLLVCNFDDSAGDAGKGTTVELLSSTPGSKPSTFAHTSDIEGCDGTAIDVGAQVWVTGLTSKLLVWFDQNGKMKKSFGSPIVDPLADSYGAQPPGTAGYAPYFNFVGDVGSGSVVNDSLGNYGTAKLLQVVTGFAVTKIHGWTTLGPSGLSYDNDNGTLYVVDGANDTVVAIDNAPNLLLKDEIVVQKGGKTFKCLYPKSTCAKLVKAGSPLDAPEASTLLPNGNLVIANTEGGNTLVEMTPTGQVLDTKVVDKSKTPGIFGLWATGKNDNDTTVFYTDTNTNTVQELEQ
jgi:DNA-binding beta-propeller fold protein YncE